LGLGRGDRFDAFESAIGGDVFVPGDRGYDEARRAWNLAADQRPAVVVFAKSAADVAQAVRFARAQGLRIVAEPKPPAPPVTIAEAFVRSMRTALCRSRRSEPGG
jgi:hypothetical protein